jgi:hypothetical protein
MVSKEREVETNLISGAASDGAESALHGACGLVDVALEGGGLVFVVGRHGYLFCWIDGLFKV